MEFREIASLCGVYSGFLLSALGCASAPSESDLGSEQAARVAATVPTSEATLARAAGPGPHFKRATPDEVEAHMAQIQTARDNARRSEEAMGSLLTRIVEDQDPQAKLKLLGDYRQLTEKLSQIAKDEAVKRLAAAGVK